MKEYVIPQSNETLENHKVTQFKYCVQELHRRAIEATNILKELKDKNPAYIDIYFNSTDWYVDLCMAIKDRTSSNMQKTLHELEDIVNKV